MLVKVENYTREMRNYREKNNWSIDNQETINQLLEVDHWKNSNKVIQDELITTITTFKNSLYVEEVISSNVVKNMIIPEDALTFYYLWNNDIIEQFHGLFE